MLPLASSTELRKHVLVRRAFLSGFLLSLGFVRCISHPIQVLSDHLVKTLNSDSARGFRPPKAGKEAEWASCLPFPLVGVICESDAGLANAGG